MSWLASPGTIRADDARAGRPARRASGTMQPKVTPGMRGRDLAGGAADLDRRRHLRVERLELARPAVQEQEDDRLVGNGPVRVGPRQGGEERRKR